MLNVSFFQLIILIILIYLLFHNKLNSNFFSIENLKNFFKSKNLDK